MAKTKAKQATKPKAFIPCVLRSLPEDDMLLAARAAADINPVNRPRDEGISALVDAGVSEPQALAFLTTKYFGSGGVKLGVAFVDNAPADLRSRLLSHFNAWGARGANVRFAEASAGVAEIRVARVRGQGYYSYLGLDCLRIPRNQPTMNLDSFTMNTPESEFLRVARHEMAHAMGAPHEHLRRSLVNRLDVQKTLEYFRRTQGWSDSVTRSNVLTPLEESSLLATPEAEETSIMAYQLPGSITKDGRPILGGKDITEMDYAFIGKVYPGAVAPPPPPPGTWTIRTAGSVIITGSGQKPVIE